MWPRRKDVLIFSVKIFYTLLLSVIGFILISIGGMILHSIFFVEIQEIIFLACGSLLLLLSFHGYKIYRAVKIIKSPKKEIVREVTLRVASVLFIVSFIYLSLVSQYHRKILDRRYECENTQKEFKGELFDIQVCRTYAYDHDKTQAARFSVFDQQGRLRALRNFVFRELNYISAPVEYRKDKLIYFNSDDKIQYLNMPPTALDRLRAHIPLSDIGQFDQLWCM